MNLRLGRAKWIEESVGIRSELVVDQLKNG